MSEEEVLAWLDEYLAHEEKWEAKYQASRKLKDQERASTPASQVTSQINPHLIVSSDKFVVRCHRRVPCDGKHPCCNDYCDRGNKGPSCDAYYAGVNTE
jgi:hypothetical protein